MIFQNMRRAFPVDRPQDKKATIKPADEQRFQINIDDRQFGMRLHQRQQVAPHAHQFMGGAGGFVKPPEELPAQRFGTAHEGPVIISMLMGGIGIKALPDRGDVKIHLIDEIGEKTVFFRITALPVKVEDTFGNRDA